MSLTSDLHREKAHTWGADHSAALCSSWELNVRFAKGEIKKILTFFFNNVFTELHVCVFYCAHMLCCLSTTQTSLLAAITSLAWQPSELVSCSGSPGIGEMMRSHAVNKRHSSRGACWCRLCTVGCSLRTGEDSSGGVSCTRNLVTFHMITSKMEF